MIFSPTYNNIRIYNLDNNNTIFKRMILVQFQTYDFSSIFKHMILVQHTMFFVQFQTYDFSETYNFFFNFKTYDFSAIYNILY
jgi:hypothetical protein